MLRRRRSGMLQGTFKSANRSSALANAMPDDTDQNPSDHQDDFEEEQTVNSLHWLAALLLPAASTALAAPPASPMAELGKDGYVNSNGVKIHYVTSGSGPLCVMIHGFPDFWYTWRAQMPELSKHFQVVAIDQRGYNLS